MEHLEAKAGRPSDRADLQPWGQATVVPFRCENTDLHALATCKVIKFSLEGKAGQVGKE